MVESDTSRHETRVHFQLAQDQQCEPGKTLLLLITKHYWCRDLPRSTLVAAPCSRPPPPPPHNHKQWKDMKSKFHNRQSLSRQTSEECLLPPHPYEETIKAIIRTTTTLNTGINFLELEGKFVYFLRYFLTSPKCFWRHGSWSACLFVII